jgi:polyhydroxybutyrate depolymerase
MRRLSLLGTLLLLSACSSGDADPEPERPSSTPAILLETDTPSPDPTAPVAGDHHLGVSLPDGTDREYLLHAPPGVDRGRPLPLVLVFHGSPGSPEDMVRVAGLDAIADKEGFLIVYPDSFTVPDEIRILLDHVAGLWPVDPRRVYATGFSRGAAATYALAEELTQRIAAFAPVSGFQYGDFALRAPTSLITFQGGQDQFATAFPEVNRGWSRAARCGPAVTTEVPLGGRSARRSVAECAAGTEHVVYRVERMGHVWPRGASRLIWGFFQAHLLER